MSKLGNEPVLISTTNLEYAVQKWSVEDLKFANHIVVREINERYAEKSQDALKNFRVGQRVEFYNKRSGDTIQGTISRINRRSITLVNCSDGKSGWRVGPSHLKVVS